MRLSNFRHFYFMKKEIWKTIEGFEDYQVSNFGRVKSLNFNHTKREKILKSYLGNQGYYVVSLYKNKVHSLKMIHKLVAMAFLNHTPDGHKLVVNHINFIKTDNRVENLEIVTHRKNSDKKHITSSSKYTGVTYYKRDKNWISRIWINGKSKHLGYFDNELEASNAYQYELLNLLK